MVKNPSANALRARVLQREANEKFMHCNHNNLHAATNAQGSQNIKQKILNAIK